MYSHVHSNGSIIPNPVGFNAIIRNYMAQVAWQNRSRLGFLMQGSLTGVFVFSPCFSGYQPYWLSVLLLGKS